MSQTKTELKHVSKFLSYILRHNPEEINLTVDSQGWADISELIIKAQSKTPLTQKLTQELIKQVVATSDKQRFKISDDGLKIRANQGHSIKVDLQLKPQQPPAILYHGTASRFIDAIISEGLKAAKRQHVHLSSDITTAHKVGQRHGKPVILTIDAQNMFKQGYQFYLSDNHVWLTNKVPSEYIALQQ